MSYIKRLLIGHDGSKFSDKVLKELKYSGLPTRLHALVLTSADTPFPTYGELYLHNRKDLLAEIEEMNKTALQQARVNARKAAATLQELFPLWDVRWEAREDPPAPALTRKILDWRVNLVVVGSHGHSPALRFLGSVSQALLIDAACSVRICRLPSSEPKPGLKILLAMDGSTGSERAYKAVLHRHWPPGTEVRLLSVLQYHPAVRVTHLVPPDVSLRRPQKNIQRGAVIKKLDSLAAELKGAGLAALPYIREGDPKKIILREASDWGAHCIFMGARGLNPLRRYMLGGVSMSVAARAPCSVEVVR